MVSGLKLALGAVVVLAVVMVAGLLLFPAINPIGTLGTQITQTPASGVHTPVLLTDPPIVPAGTTALVIDYSSVKVHTSGTANSGWVSASGSGTINLLGLINTTEVIGTADIPANSTIDMIRFNVSSATITINGTTSNVTVPSRTVTAHITGKDKVNATSGLLLDLSPTVATIYTANSTVFVMVPSVRAIVVGNVNVSSHQSVGSKEQLNASARKDLEDVKPNISIVASSMSVSGNSTTLPVTVTLSVTVKDSSNSSIMLRHILVFGNYSVVVVSAVGANVVHANAHVIAIGNNIAVFVSNVVVSAVGANSVIHVIEDNGSIRSINDVHANISASHNSTGDHARSNFSISAKNDSNVTLNTSAALSDGSTHGENVISPGASYVTAPFNYTVTNPGSSESSFMSEGIHVQNTRVFNFLIYQNSTLALPSLSAESDGQGLGYNLTAGSTATFIFSGELSFGSGHILITPTSGSKYHLVVSGENGASASANVTAN